MGWGEGTRVGGCQGRRPVRGGFTAAPLAARGVPLRCSGERPRGITHCARLARSVQTDAASRFTKRAARAGHPRCASRHCTGAVPHRAPPLTADALVHHRGNCFVFRCPLGAHNNPSPTYRKQVLQLSIALASGGLTEPPVATFSTCEWIVIVETHRGCGLPTTQTPWPSRHKPSWFVGCSVGSEPVCASDRAA